ncbi:MAG: hypothetical protein AAGK47_03145, partial [Bacteroidota bacterium]
TMTNKLIYRLCTFLSLLSVVACRAPRVAEVEPLKTVEEIRRDAHRTPTDDTTMPKPTLDNN